MTCGDLTHRLPERWAGELSPDLERELDAHLSSCAACREEARALDALWTRLDEVGEEAPPVSAAIAKVARRIHVPPDVSPVSGEGFRSSSRAPWGVRVQPVWQMAAVLFLAAAAFMAGRSWPDAARKTELAEMRGELHGMRQIVALSLLRQESASERLRGVTWSAEMDQPGAEVIGALVDTLQHDGNVNVRLAAIEALRHYGGDGRVREALIRALPADPSPLVQIALIDAMVALKERTSADALRALSGDPSINESVRQRARRGLQQIL